MHCLKATFDKILYVLKDALGDQYLVDGNLKRPGPKPRFTDIEVIALNLAAECLGIDSELYLFNKLECDYKDRFPNLISRRQYNDRRKSLFNFQNSIRIIMTSKLNELADIFTVDSMPIEICKLSRLERNRMGKEDPSVAPDKGFCASQNKYYFGYKIHAICSTNGVIEEFDLTKASVHDIHFLKNAGRTFSNCTIIGDRGYVSRPLAEELRENNVQVEVPYRNNQKDRKPSAYIFKKMRKRIETVFSQLCDQFMIQRNYAKSFFGFKTRILAKISGFTLAQFVNKFITGRPMGKIKYSLSYMLKPTKMIT